MINDVNVLVVEDDLALQEAIIDTLKLSSIKASSVPSAEKALELLGKQKFDMVISDVNMPGMDGHQLLSEIKSRFPYLPVLLITAYATIDKSVKAIQSGAVDYLVKPFKPNKLISIVKKYTLGFFDETEGPVIASSISREVFKMSKKVALTDSTVLISGESGTGKEVLARYIHTHSSRKDAPFVAINCAAIPESMLEATLFGYEKGAFTGAHQATPGKFEHANGGTLLLDEISEMDLLLQAKLLRVLQEREVERLGSRQSIALDLRIIATTNKKLDHQVKIGEFREDLFYRLSVFPIHWPSLRDRKEDILPLAEYFLSKHTKKMGRVSINLSSEVTKYLLSYDWPGNVRELDNAIQRALILQDGNILYQNDFNLQSGLDINVSFSDDLLVKKSTKKSTDYKKDIQEHEFNLIYNALVSSDGSKKFVAEQLGMSPRTLRYKMAKMRDLGYSI